MTEKDPGQIELENQIAKNDLNATGAASNPDSERGTQEDVVPETFCGVCCNGLQKIEELAA